MDFLLAIAAVDTAIVVGAALLVTARRPAQPGMSPSAMNDIPEILFLGIFVAPLLLHAVLRASSL